MLGHDSERHPRGARAHPTRAFRRYQRPRDSAERRWGAAEKPRQAHPGGNRPAGFDRRRSAGLGGTGHREEARRLPTPPPSLNRLAQRGFAVDSAARAFGRTCALIFLYSDEGSCSTARGYGLHERAVGTATAAALESGAADHLRTFIGVGHAAGRYSLARSVEEGLISVAEAMPNATEQLNFQFRAEFFNIFNHPQFALPGGSISPGADLADCAGCFSTQTPDVAQGNPGLG